MDGPDTAQTAGSLTERLDELVLAQRILGMEGHDEITLGHVSWRDAEGRGFWIKRHGIAMADVMGIEDLVLISFDGEKLEGDGNCHSEWPIHSEIYLARDDVQSIGHTHAMYATMFSATDETLRAIAHAGAYFQEDVPRYTITAHLVRSKKMGQGLAAALGDAPAVFMRNHGITFVGRSVPHGVIMGYFLERACFQQITLGASGLDWAGSTAEEVKSKGPNLMTDAAVDMFWKHFCVKLAKLESAQG
jgi:L-ribulose-5-phosphate 4-epimerase